MKRDAADAPESIRSPLREETRVQSWRRFMNEKAMDGQTNVLTAHGRVEA